MLKLNEITNKMNLLIESNDRTYFETYTGAVRYAKEQILGRGYEIDEDEWEREIAFGPGKPGGDMPQIYKGEIPPTRHKITLYKNGKKQSEMANIIVAYVGYGNSDYELTFYIS